MRSRVRTSPWTQRRGGIRRIEWAIGLFSQRRRWRSMEAMMKSDLEIENAASPPLRRSLAGHKPALHHRRLHAIDIVARKSFTATVRKATGLTPRGFRRSLE